MSHVICTFNVNNLYARYRFAQSFPGDRAQKSLVGDDWGYLPQYQDGFIELFNAEQRALAGAAITQGKTAYPDVVCLMEVESLLALRKFNEVYLDGAYPNALLIDSRDFRQIDVAILSKLEVRSVRSHVDDVDPDPKDPKRPWLFSRDCVEVEIALNKSASKRLVLFVNHLKSKYAESAEETTTGDALRLRQSRRVRQIIRDRFPGEDFTKELFAVVGDLNDQPTSPALQPLAQGAGLVDALERVADASERWTHWYRSENTVSQLDHVLLSPALDKATKGTPPHMERRGIGCARILADGGPGPKRSKFVRMDDDPHAVEIDFQFGRFAEVTPTNYASDHCPVFFEVP